MSWDVEDVEWLRVPPSSPRRGPIDGFDARVVGELGAGLSGPPRRKKPEPEPEPVAAEPVPAEPVPAAPAVAAPEPEAEPEPTEMGSVPPPPTSAAFDDDPNLDPPSYESGRFDELDGEGQGDSPAPAAEAEAGFTIPTLATSGEAPAAVVPAPAEPAAPAPEAAAADEPSFVIPSLSAPASAEGEADPVEEGEAEVVEEVEVDAVVYDDIPVRTGETVIGRAPEPTPEERAAYEARVAQEQAETKDADAGVFIPGLVAGSNVSAAVYDDEDDDGAVIPESIVNVDSGELELLEDTAVEGAPVDPDADTVVEPAPEDPSADASAASADAGSVVIPQLARPAEEVTPSAPPATSEASEGAGLVLPSLTAPAAEAAQEAAEEVEEVEDLDEVQVEDLDDLQEVEEVDEVDEVQEVEEVAGPPSAPPATPPAAPTESKPPSPPPAESKPPAPPAAPEAARPRRRKAWYDDVFAEHYLYLYPPSWGETARRDSEFVAALLGKEPGSTILDVGCGDGRHAIELAKLGYQVAGIDNSLALLLSAGQSKELAEIGDDAVDFIHGDMRQLPRDRQYDGVMCIGSTFGYFEEEQNRQVLEEMIGRLAPGGRLLLHVFNRDFVAPHLPARSWWQGKRCMVLDEAEMNFFASRLRVHRTIIFDDGRQYEHYMFMRAYTVQDLGKALSHMGMRVLEVAGSRDTRNRFYGSASPEIWMVAERK